MAGGVTALALCRYAVWARWEADSVAEGFEVADRPRLGLGGGTPSEVACAGITLEVAVRAQVPGRHEYRMLHGDKCFHRTRLAAKRRYLAAKCPAMR